jgi:glycosyltransferase involved in cell wall biosynthesis
MSLLTLIIPVYNERRTISEIIEKVKPLAIKNNWEVIVVDDGSNDGTYEFLRDYKDKFFKLLRHERNMGKGTSIRTGIEHASSKYTIIQDADLEYLPEEIEILLNYAIDKNADAVYGSRFKDSKKKGSFLFYLGNLFLTFITNILFRSKITDMETCYKLVRTDVLKTLNLKSKRFEIEPEITAKLLKRGIKIHELPISYFPRKAGKKIKVRDGIYALKKLIEVKLFG